MIMKVLFLNPPFLPRFSRSQRSPAVTKSGTIYYPMWLALAAGLLEKFGFDVHVLDAPAEKKDMAQVATFTRNVNPNLVVVDTSTPSIYHDITVAGHIKDLYPKAFVTLVGTHVSALPEGSLAIDERIDGIARREYDYTILDLARLLAGAGKWREQLKGVEGLSFRIDGNIIHNPDRPFIEDLDEIPFASRIYKRHLKVENYFYASLKYPVVAIMSGRGCPYGCSFCVYPQVFTGRKYRFRSPENVVEELLFIEKELPQVKEVFFEDDTLTAKKSRLRELCEEIIRRGLRITWSTNSRADIDYESLNMMKRAGCRLLCVGFESGDQDLLGRMEKRLRIAQSKEFMRNARRAGVLVHGCFLFGCPGETKQTMRKTLDLALELRPYTAQFFPIMVYPGTEAYSYFREKGYLTTEDYSQWLTEEGFHNSVVSTENISARELVLFCDYARRKFYLHPKYVLFTLRHLAVHPGEMKRFSKAFGAFHRVLFRGSFANNEGG